MPCCPPELSPKPRPCAVSTSTAFELIVGVARFLFQSNGCFPGVFPLSFSFNQCFLFHPVAFPTGRHPSVPFPRYLKLFACELYRYTPVETGSLSKPVFFFFPRPFPRKSYAHPSRTSLRVSLLFVLNSSLYSPSFSLFFLF